MDTGIGGDSLSSYAAGMKYSFGDMYVGLGHASHSFDAVAGVAAVPAVAADAETDPIVVGSLEVPAVAAIAKQSANVTSLFAGGSFGAIKVAALYSDASFKNGAAKSGAKAFGLNTAYTMDALTISAGYSEANFDAPRLDQKAFGIGAAYNLGGGASISGGIASVESVGDENQGSGKAKETRADVGVKFSF